MLLKCPLYAELRNEFFTHACRINSNFINMSDDERFIYMFNTDDMQFYTAKICHDV